jgi:hypothetical protein
LVLSCEGIDRVFVLTAANRVWWFDKVEWSPTILDEKYFHPQHAPVILCNGLLYDILTGL